MNGSLADLGNAPDACCRWLNGELNRHGIHIVVKSASEDMIVLGVIFDSVDLGEPDRYPAEAVTVVVRPTGTSSPSRRSMTGAPGSTATTG